MGQYSTTDAATKLGMNARTVKRLCQKQKLGTIIGRTRVLSEADIAKLSAFKGREAGNPDWIAKRPKPKKRGKKASKSG